MCLSSPFETRWHNICGCSPMFDHRFASHVEYRRSRTSHMFTMSAYFPDLSPEDDNLHRFVIVMGTCKDQHTTFGPSAQASCADRNMFASWRESAHGGFVDSGLGILHESRITCPKPQAPIPDGYSGEFAHFSNDLMFSRRLRSLRLRQNLSLFDLAQRSGVPIHFLADCEQGCQEPDGTILQRLALALGVQSSKLQFPTAQ